MPCPDCDRRVALKSDGTVWTWGDNADSYAREGPVTWLDPAQVGGLVGVVAIATGDYHNLALKSDGTVWGWGNDGYGQLGDGWAPYWTMPVQLVTPGSPDLAIAMSHDGDFTIGGFGVYTLTVANAGQTLTADTINISDLLPPGLTLVSANGTDWGCSSADQAVTCTNPGAVEPGASSAITLTVKVGPAAWPGVTNFATVSNTSDRNLSNNAIADPTVVRQP
jgi:uncharacterized repeat protein (TIGR01451 family)